MDAANCALACGLVSTSYIRQGEQALARRHRLVKALLSSRQLPAKGWDEATIEMLVRDCAAMDSNNFLDNVGVGEREGRVACPLVARRHLGLAHGVGRSGDVGAEQPKAAGSSLMAALAGALAADALRVAGFTGLGPVCVLPLATGMSLTLVLLALRQQRGPGATHVVWSRVDQKTCLKAITAAGLVPHPVELVRGAAGAAGAAAGAAAGGGAGRAARRGAGVQAAERAEQAQAGGEDADADELRTDVEAIAAAISTIGADRIAAVITTSSCFAPRACDDLVAVAKLCAAADVPHVINNAYGVQSRATCGAVCSAWAKGRVDAVVQSTDKNFMVPVGGALVAAPASRPGLVAAVTSTYPGRAGNAAVVDLLMTLLHWGSEGWKKVLAEREALVPHLRDQLQCFAARHGERLLHTPGNPISMALTLDTLVAASRAAKAGAAERAAAAAAAGAEGPEAAEGSAATEVGGGAGAVAQAGASGAAAAGAGKAPTVPDVTFFGSMLWQRCVSGTRVVAPGKTQCIGGITFSNYGSHTDVPYPSTYMTVAAALGTTRDDVDELVRRLDKCFAEFKKKCGAAA